MCTYRYILPWLKKSLNLKVNNYPSAILQQDFSFKPELQYFLQVKIDHSDDGKIKALPMIGKGSGDLANLVNCQAFLELPMEKTEFKEGEAYPLIVFE